jgi:MoxR-like ATPase
MGNQIIKALTNAVTSKIKEKDFEVNLAIATLLSGGNLLIQDVPGTGKTALAKTLATAINGTFERIQCTPELLPSDIIGVNIYNRDSGEFKFSPGPIFANILLLDELNRASPRTQSALLEAMEERQVTVSGTKYGLAEFFSVIATQNPIDGTSTYELPYAQLDRFDAQITLGYPSKDAMFKIILESTSAQSSGTNTDQNNVPSAVISMKDFVKLRGLASEVYIDAKVLQYALDICYQLQTKPGVIFGPSTRAIKSFVQLLKIWSFVNGREYVLPDDIKKLIAVSLKHRIILDLSNYQNAYNTLDNLIAEVLSEIREPSE